MKKNIKQQVLNLSVLSLFGLVLLCSCRGKTEIRRTLQTFQSKTVTFPEQMMCFTYGHPQDSIIGKGSWRIVVYIDFSECSLCRINHLSDDAGIVELSESFGVPLYIILSPLPEEQQDVIKAIRDNPNIFPIWLDNQSSFAQMNEAVIPRDTRFHYFLLDEQGKVRVVGNPSCNEKIKELYINSLMFNLRDKYK